MSQDFETDSAGRPFAFHDLPANSFPFLVRYLREDGYILGAGPMVNWCIVTDAMVMKVPGHDFPVSVQMQFANGECVLITSDQRCYTAELPEEAVEGIKTVAQAVADGKIENGQMPPLENP